MEILNTIYEESNKKSKTRDSIVRSALQIGANEGFSALTMPRVAEDSGITLRNLYRYYENIDWLIIDVMYYFYNSKPHNEKLQRKTDESGADYLRRIMNEKFMEQFFADDFVLLPGFSNYSGLRLMFEFNFFLLKLPPDNPVFLRYTQLYSKDVNGEFKAALGEAFECGILDGSLRMTMDERDFYVEYVMQSMSGLINIVLLKGHERRSINPTLIKKNIEVILFYLQK